MSFRPRRTLHSVVSEIYQGIQSGDLSLDIESGFPSPHALETLVWNRVLKSYSLGDPKSEQSLLCDIQHNIKHAKTRLWAVGADWPTAMSDFPIYLSNDVSKICRNPMLDARIVVSHSFNSSDDPYRIPAIFGNLPKTQSSRDSRNSLRSSGTFGPDCFRQSDTSIRYWILIIDDTAYCHMSQFSPDQRRNGTTEFESKVSHSPVFKCTHGDGVYESCERMFKVLWDTSLKMTPLLSSGTK